MQGTTLDIAILIRKMNPACKVHYIATTTPQRGLSLGLAFIQSYSVYISVSNGVGVKVLINQQPATLSEP